MKTKLLKKIRKKYSIVYYPNGYKCIDDKIHHKGKYIVFRHWCYYLESSIIYRLPAFLNKQDAINYILKSVRVQYRQYSRKYVKTNHNGIKVWYNGK